MSKVQSHSSSDGTGSGESWLLYSRLYCSNVVCRLLSNYSNVSFSIRDSR